MHKKTSRILMLLYIVALIIMVSGATFAYFDFIKVSRVSPKVEVGTATTDLIAFEMGKKINITPTTENFRKGMGNLTDETFASVYAKSNQNGTATQVKYNLYLEIEKNTLNYSTSSKSPELIMEIIDHDGKELTSIPGLNYTEVGGVKGFDITTAKGRYYITKDFAISMVTENTHIWKAKFTFVNLEESQDGNLEKELKGFIRIERADKNE